jgi:cell division protein FtsZ
MIEATNQDMMPFDLPKNRSSVIKVIGVGGGGGNAVNHMYDSGIKGVDFVICNTDSQALENSPIPNKIQLGVSLTEGLGAGADPKVGQEAAQESILEIEKLLETNTKMVFITAGMGGGTGTGAAPVIAKTAKDRGILTVGIVTHPFSFEGKNRQEQAERGIEELRSVVDSLVIINNNKLREVYGNLGFKAGFAKADEVLATAARGIAEVITNHYRTNIDLKDARAVLENSGTAIMGAATASGESRAKEAINAALDSPLLNDNHIRGAKNVLLLIVSGTEEITIDEIGEVNDFIQQEAGHDANIIMGIGEDESLGNEVSITIIATGFNADQQTQVIGKAPAKIVHPLEDEQPISTSLYNAPVKMDEEDEHFRLDAELDKALAAEEARREEQITLFAEDNEFEKPIQDPTSQPIEGTKDLSSKAQALADEFEIKRTISQDPQEVSETSSDSVYELIEEEEKPIEDHPMFQLGEEKKVEATEAESKDVSLEDDSFNFFMIDKDEEIESNSDRLSSESDLTSYPSQEISEPAAEVILEASREEIPVAKDQRKVYTLEDMQNLEEQLSKPKEELQAAEPLDESLNFQLKTKKKASSSFSSTTNGDPMDASISDSLRIKGEERRSKLKAFNYKFRNNPRSISEVDSEPAYKRHGINIEQGAISQEENQGRMTLKDGEEGPDLKNNNSFLHDNVD